jgi:hypothetical protein
MPDWKPELDKRSLEAIASFLREAATDIFEATFNFGRPVFGARLGGSP